MDSLDVLIRLARASELNELESLQRRASLANPGDRDALLANPDAIDLPPDQIAAGQVLVAERGGRILGFAAVLPRGDGDFELDALFVEPDHWRQGIGRALVAGCAEAALAHGASALHVIGNPHAEGFYSREGFETLGTLEMRFGAGLLMRKRLNG
jgi:GNAT superfamily N-acetyltransferase